MVFVEAPAFTRLLPSYLTDDEDRQLQEALRTAPEVGAIMPQTGGFRKLRWPDPRRGKGTRSGLRIIYYYFREHAQIWLMTLYGKDELKDLTAAQKRPEGCDRRGAARAHGAAAREKDEVNRWNVRSASCSTN